MAQGGPPSGGLDPANKEELDEIMDSKVQQAYERLRNDNWVIWKESLKLAEKEFSERGIKETMEFLPKVVYDKEDLKREINTLMHEEDKTPRPVVKISSKDK